jgi:curved DNA-binding protein CbpA
MTGNAEAAGAIAPLSIPAVLRDLTLQHATGQLVASRGDAIKKVFFKNGAVIYAVSNRPEDRLGDVLLAQGAITREQYEEAASQVVATNRKQGTILVQIGALSPKDLFRGLIAQVREIVLSLIPWGEGSWRFLDGLPTQEEIVSLRLNTSGIVFEGLARLGAAPDAAAIWEPAAYVLAASAQPALALEELDCPVTAKRLLSLIEQGRPWGEAARQAGRDEREAAAMLYGLVLFGQVTALPRPQAAAAPPAEPEPPAAHPAPATAAPAPAAREEELRLQRERITALAAKFAKLNFYQLLGLTPQAEPETIKRAYIALAKEHHPDRFFRPELEDLQESVNAIFMRINEAYTTLHNPGSRAEYDREVLKVVQPERVKDPEEDSRIAREQFQKGMGQLNAGDVWSAIQSLRWAVNLSPQNPRYHTYLGVALTRTKKRLHEAEEHCKTAIALDYNNSQYYVHLGQVYKTGRLFDKARRQFEQALRLDPKHPQALKEMADLSGQTPEKGLIERFLGK